MSNVYGVIYCATNIVNQKRYVGQTRNRVAVVDLLKYLSKRYSKKGHNLHLDNALKKYGFDGFKWQLVCECSSREELDKREIEHIALWKTNDSRYGYNKLAGGSSLSEEALLRLSLSLKETLALPEVKARQSAASKAVWANASIENREKRNVAIKNALNKPDVKERHSKAVKESLSTPKAKENRSKGLRKMWADADRKLRRKVTDARPDVKKRRSDATKLAMSNPETKEKQRIATKRQFSNPKNKKKMIESLSGRKIMSNPEMSGYKHVKVDEVDQYLELGWTFGRPKK